MDVTTVALVLVGPLRRVSLLVPVMIAGRSLVRTLGPATGFVAGAIGFVLEAATGPVFGSLLSSAGLSGPTVGLGPLAVAAT